MNIVVEHVVTILDALQGLLGLQEPPGYFTMQESRTRINGVRGKTTSTCHSISSPRSPSLPADVVYSTWPCARGGTRSSDLARVGRLPKSNGNCRHSSGRGGTHLVEYVVSGGRRATRLGQESLDDPLPALSPLALAGLDERRTRTALLPLPILVPPLTTHSCNLAIGSTHMHRATEIAKRAARGRIPRVALQRVDEMRVPGGRVPLQDADDPEQEMTRRLEFLRQL